MNRLCDLLFTLSAKLGVSGREDTSLAEGLLRPFVDEIRRDSAGNIIALRRGNRKNAKRIMVDAHIDEVGLIVQRIDDNGFVHFVNHTRLDGKILPGADVVICAKEPIYGVIASKPPHLQSEKEQDEVLAVEDMVIDVGLSADAARRVIREGDTIALQGECAKLLSHCVKGKTFDDRACVAVIIAAMEKLSKLPLENDIYVVFSAGEERGGYGAKQAAMQIHPDEAIVLDVSFAHCPDAKEQDCGLLGAGPMIGVAPILFPAITQKMKEIAARREIPFQIEAMGGRTGTNGDGIVTLFGGLKVGLLSLPLRYMHTASEVVSLEDMAYMRDLLAAYLCEGDR